MVRHWFPGFFQTGVEGAAARGGDLVALPRDERGSCWRLGGAWCVCWIGLRGAGARRRCFPALRKRMDADDPVIALGLT